MATRSKKRQIDAVEGPVVEAAPAAPPLRIQGDFITEIQKYDWKVTEEEVRPVVASSLYSGIKNQFHCITKNFLYGLTEGSIDNSSKGGVVFVIYYRGEFPCLIPGGEPDAEYIYNSDSEIFPLFWEAMKNVGSSSLVERAEGKREEDFSKIKKGSTAGWNICFLNTMSVWIDMPGGTYLQLIQKQPEAVAPAGGRPKQNQKNKKNNKRKTKKLRKRTTKRKSKKSRKH